MQTVLLEDSRVKGWSGVFRTVPVPPWSTFTAIGESRAVRSCLVWMFLIPVVARILSPITKQISLSIFDHTLTFDLTLPFSWKVLYISSLAFGLASLIYSLQCPRLIRMLAIASEDELGQLTRHDAAKLIAQALQD